MFEESIVFHKAAVQNIYSAYYFKTSSMCIFNAVKIQSDIEFIVDALFGNFAYLHNLYTVVELHTNFVLIHSGSQPVCSLIIRETVVQSPAQTFRIKRNMKKKYFFQRILFTSHLEKTLERKKKMTMAV